MNALTRVVRSSSVVAILGLAAGLVACGSNQTSSGGPTQIQQQSLSADGSNSASAIQPLGDTNSTMKTQRAEAPAKLVPTAMRAGAHQNFDRVVIELAGEGTPGWHVDYTTTPQQQASGLDLKVSGDSFLNVNIDGTTYPFEVGIPDPELTPVKGEGPAVVEVVSGGTFEGRSQFVIGLKGDRRPYSVAFLEDPKRLVIDFEQS
ncbi:hypothetical protein WG915_04685 [Corynebacterium sp. H128]|uniref:AMIN-like domain-containing (lipo)protein n=1 Tax=unclassified Corynebacterium TaxID=2624378 RepID=UPI0030A1C473